MSNLQLADAKAHMRVTIDDDDTLIQAKIDAAEAWIADYLGVALSTFSPYPATLMEASKQLVGFFYDNREAAIVGNGIVITPTSPGFYDLLEPYRTFVF